MGPECVRKQLKPCSELPEPGDHVLPSTRRLKSVVPLERPCAQLSNDAMDFQRTVKKERTSSNLRTRGSISRQHKQSTPPDYRHRSPLTEAVPARYRHLSPRRFRWYRGRGGSMHVHPSTARRAKQVMPEMSNIRVTLNTDKTSHRHPAPVPS